MDHLLSVSVRVWVCVCVGRAGLWLQANKANRGGGKFGGWRRTLRSDAVQTRDTDLQERNASRDSWPALTHIGRIRLNKSEKVKEGGVGWSCRGHAERSKMGALLKTLTTLSYLKHKEGSVVSDTTKN